MKDVCATFRQNLDFHVHLIAKWKLHGQENPDFAATKKQIRELLGVKKPANEMSLEELLEALRRARGLYQAMGKASEVLR